MQIFTANMRLSLAYIIIFAGIGLHLPFFPVWLADRGLDASERALVLAMPMFMRVVALSYLIEWGLALGSPARAIFAFGVLAAVFTGGLFFCENGLLIVVLSIFSSLIWMPVLPLLDASAMGAMRAGRADYGTARLWGSVAFLLASLLGGAMIDRFGVALLIPTLAFILVMLALSGLLLPRESEPGVRAGVGQSLWLIFQQCRGFRHLFIAGALIQASHGLLYVQGSVHWKSLGYSETAIGALWMISILAEILLFFYSKRLIARFSARTLLLAGGGAAVVRWSLMAFDPPTGVLIVLQVLHALTFALTHIATTWLIARLFPGLLAAQAQGLFVSVMGAANGLAMLSAGPLYAHFLGAGQGGMAVLALIAVILAVAEKNQLPTPHRL